VTDSSALDAALVERVLKGETSAFRGLVDRYWAECARYAWRMLGHREDAEDALQNSFVRAYRSLGEYAERHAFRAWLYRILVNECRSLARGRWRRARRLVDDTTAAERRPAPSTERDGDIRDALQRALDRIEPLLREAFLLRYGEELHYEEIATMTGATVSAVKMRVKRARDAMRPELEEVFHD
jgi:RNA polymerase sigma-70 factor (ECF subfamily)